jgi:hypothetical protein
MVFNQVIYRRADDVAYNHPVFGNNLFQYVTEVVAYRAYAVEGVFLIVGVVGNQVTEKIFERGTY